VTPEQWSELQHRAQRAPNGSAESERLRSYVEYADALRRFQAARVRAGNDEDRKTLAKVVDEGLEMHLARREISLSEARRIKSAVLEELVEDPSRRSEALALWTSRHELVRGSDRAEAEAQRKRQFQREQQALVQAWQAQAPTQRDPRALEEQLEALRRASFQVPGR
jgi:hypothetical protein